MQVNLGTEVSEPFSVSTEVRQDGLLYLYVGDLDDLSVKLNDCTTDCMVGNLINHLMYVDDVVILSHHSADYLRVCASYGAQYDIVLNPKKKKKSVIVIATTKKHKTNSLRLPCTSVRLLP